MLVLDRLRTLDFMVALSERRSVPAPFVRAVPGGEPTAARWAFADSPPAPDAAPFVRAPILISGGGAAAAVG